MVASGCSSLPPGFCAISSLVITQIRDLGHLLIGFVDDAELGGKGQSLGCFSYESERAGQLVC